MTELLFAPYMMPFTVALGLLFGLLALELVAALAGASLMAGGGEADADFDLDAGLDADLDVDLDGFDVSDLDVDIDVDGIEIDGAETTDPGVAGGLLSWLGLGEVPFLIWLGVFLACFGLAGLILQTVLMQAMGFALPPTLASLVAALPAIGFTRRLARGLARLVPKMESEALSQNHLGRRRGVVSQGTAARGRPAEVRVTDRYGNTHYLRAEPLRDGEELPQGTEVLVLRKALHEGYRLVALND